MFIYKVSGINILRKPKFVFFLIKKIKCLHHTFCTYYKIVNKLCCRFNFQVYNENYHNTKQLKFEMGKLVLHSLFIISTVLLPLSGPRSEYDVSKIIEVSEAVFHLSKDLVKM